MLEENSDAEATLKIADATAPKLQYQLHHAGSEWYSSTDEPRLPSGAHGLTAVLASREDLTDVPEIPYCMWKSSDIVAKIE